MEKEYDGLLSKMDTTPLDDQDWAELMANVHLMLREIAQRPVQKKVWFCQPSQVEAWENFFNGFKLNQS